MNHINCSCCSGSDNENHNHTDKDTQDKLYELISRTDNFSKLSNIFAQMADPSRMRIFWMLCHCEECVQDIAIMVNMSSPAVSHHLKNLKDAGLIESRRNGKEVFYKATDSNTAKSLHLAIESIMEAHCPHAEDYSLVEEVNPHSELHKDQEEIIKEVHRYMLRNISERITIEKLSKEFHMNTTTLKSAFKTVYGTSIAAHMKEHRMVKASQLIKDDKLSLHEIGNAVGYDSQSKFTAAFKEHFGCTPSEYRKRK